MKGIFLDIGWTLCYPASGDWMISKKCMEYIDPAILHTIPQARIESAHSAAMKYLDDNHLVLTEDDEFAQFKNYYKLFSMALPELGLSVQSLEEMAADKVYNVDNYCFYDDVKPVLEELRKDYKLGIISDTWPSMLGVLKKTGIYDYFDSVTFSCSLGVFKPHPKMYEHAIHSMELPPSETVFADDSLVNLEAAATHGIVPVLIERKNYPSKSSKSKFKTITSLYELLDI